MLGRIICLISAFLPFWFAAAADLAFPFVLCAVAAKEIVAARNRRNLVMPVPIGAIVWPLILARQRRGEIGLMQWKWINEKNRAITFENSSGWHVKWREERVSKELWPFRLDWRPGAT